MTQEDESQGRGGELTHIGKILSGLPESGVGKSPKAGLEKPTTEEYQDECECRTCGNKFQGSVTRYLRFDPPKEVRARECPDCKAKREAEEENVRQEQLAAARPQVRERWRKTCGIDPELQGKTFKNFDGRIQRQAYQAALKWVEEFNIESPRGIRSLLFYSAVPGVGKTHLMVGIADHIFDNWEGDPIRSRSPIIFASGPALVKRVRACFDIRKGDDRHEREEDVYRELAGVALLMLDDVGKEKPSDFTRELYWYIIDERVKTGLPVVITSRLPLEGKNSLEELMGVDTVDRLYGMTRGELIEMTGQSYRRGHAVP